jgi:uncharacterized short protein YbdD (DUF466 family)
MHRNSYLYLNISVDNGFKTADTNRENVMPNFMKTILYIIILVTFFFSCQKTVDSEYYLNTVNTTQSVDGKETIVVQMVYTKRRSDSLTISQLTKMFNYDDNIQIGSVFGIRKTDGLSEAQLDSFYYNKNGKDTFTVNYINKQKTWRLTQRVIKGYNKDNQIAYLKTERPNSPKSTYQEFYKYNDKGQLVCETVYECIENRRCDSLFKTLYYYNATGLKDSISNYIWENKTWIYRKGKEKTSQLPH